ncbi:Suppressor of G2 allele of SKP1 [Nosema bombycis CQ1]|uniref:Suppressor of G2 allele of SKP1 n=1 Tax=Nosema bombycis (strain CQ1 / CVCC 102059) TaxID=578461 RepID=R0KMW5_NOSB1|nr:Suppressor of G2 allele of SKP1 [Nosema bombycis CQ1]|eukprot:EOB11472.1 Suppressor of G2 allele of SKP1 [Nosema bombycis CQ1]
MDFAETKDKIFIFLYNTEIETAFMEDSVTLVIKPLKSIILYRPVFPDITIKKTESKVELVLKKKENIKWYTINGPKTKEYKPRFSKQKEIDLCKEEVTNNIEEDAFTLISRIYDISNDDVRRAMEKSFIESDGTVFSTDWEEVKNKKVLPKK